MGHESRRLAVYKKILASRGKTGFYTAAADVSALAAVRALTAHTQYQARETESENTSDEIERLRLFCLADSSNATFGGVDTWNIGDVYFLPGDYDPDGATAADRQINPPFVFQGTYLNDGPNDDQAATIEVVRQIRQRQGRRA